ncbi:hypothetical protein HUG10_21375 (plasmid) [Halorarum halophilum]|uniref:Uncharacterized protein n=1 Tax=Halorarum halophilum TaxID=2743090 RepID=A0A7D5K444_9EURY|nr:DUF5802 family protein [Halobaculum halophilum]QLG30141.1 hypothetical protein HUG10_21375 [Halobaculum halophilum]
MYVEHLSPGYWVTELDVVEWDDEYAVMDTADHAALAEFVYGCSNHPLLVKEHRNTNVHLPVYPESSIPEGTIVVPAEKPAFESSREIVLIVKENFAKKLFRLMG